MGTARAYRRSSAHDNRLEGSTFRARSDVARAHGHGQPDRGIRRSPSSGFPRCTSGQVARVRSPRMRRPSATRASRSCWSPTGPWSAGVVGQLRRRPGGCRRRGRAVRRPRWRAQAAAGRGGDRLRPLQRRRSRHLPRRRLGHGRRQDRRDHRLDRRWPGRFRDGWQAPAQAFGAQDLPADHRRHRLGVLLDQRLHERCRQEGLGAGGPRPSPNA